jgi:3-dehydroquinate dehydratase-2
MTRILLVQGDNVAHPGKRQPEICGTATAAGLDRMLQRHAKTRGLKLDIYCTHIEGEAIARIYRAADEGIDGLLMNPAGFTHAGCALRDCLRSIKFPYVEVHLSNIEKRGLTSVTAEAARGIITGFGLQSYFMGMDALLDLIKNEKTARGKKK